MNAKFVIFLVATCLVQGFQAETLDLDQRGIVDDIIAKIKDLIKKVEDAISEVTGQLPQIIETIKDKIKEIIGGLNIDQLIKDLQEKLQAEIEKILAEAGIDPEKVKPCMEAEKAAVEKLSQEALQGFVNCKNDAENEIADLVKEVQEVSNKATTLLTDAKAAVTQCIQDNGANIIGLIKCLKDHLETLTGDVNALITQVQSTVALAQQKANEVPEALAKCVAGVSAETANKQKDIIDEFTKCVQTTSSN